MNKIWLKIYLKAKKKRVIVILFFFCLKFSCFRLISVKFFFSFLIKIEKKFSRFCFVKMYNLAKFKICLFWFFFFYIFAHSHFFFYICSGFFFSLTCYYLNFLLSWVCARACIFLFSNWPKNLKKIKFYKHLYAK